MESEMDIQSRAAQWLVRLRDGDDATWEDFVEWLALDPRHGEAYDRVEQLDHAIEPLLTELVFRTAANDSEDYEKALNQPASSPRRWIFGGTALAASLAAALLLAPQFTSGQYEVTTRPGEHRIVSLDSGTHVTLNGATRIIFDHRNPRFASLESGEALFQVRHDPARPFTLTIGDNRVQDVGTIFNVVRDHTEVRVAVAEGAVLYNPGDEAVALGAGQGLVDKASKASIQVGPTAIEAVGSWQKGRLVYSRASLKQVAADLARSLGVRIAVVPSVADRTFTGILLLNDKGLAQRKQLEVALNVALIPGRDGWTMKPVSSVGD